jgi:uncharacterized protein
MDRRAFLRCGLAAAGLSALSAPNASALADDVALRMEVVRIPLLPKSFDGFRIGFLSDPHLGPWVPDELVAQAVQRLKNEKVDLVCFGGDFIGIPESFPGGLFPIKRNEKLAALRKSAMPDSIFGRVAGLLAGIRSANGSFAVYGNHDNWVGPRICRRKLAEGGITILKNEGHVVNRGGEALRLLGCDDYWTGVPAFAAPAKKPEREIRVLLCHNPDYVSYLLESTNVEFDLALCGHTHGGQIKLPFIGALSYNIRDRRFGEGLVRHAKGQVYTSRGIGVVEIPFRLNCPPEVSVLVLLRG